MECLLHIKHTVYNNRKNKKLAAATGSHFSSQMVPKMGISKLNGHLKYFHII